MGFIDPYDGVDWAGDERHLAQLHTHQPRNAVQVHSADHDPAVDAEVVPVDDLGKNDLSPASGPDSLLRKYRYTGHTVFALTEHEYYVDREKYKQTPYEEMPDRLDRTMWPPAEWGADPDELGVLALQGAELRGSLDGTLQDVIALDAAVGHGRQEPMDRLLERIDAANGLAVLPHPSKYHDPSEYEAYVPVFEASDSLAGMEVFNANDRYPSRELWDRLLTHFGAERPVWAFAGDDYHGRARPSDGKRFNRSRVVALVPSLSKTAVREALSEGRSYVQFNGDGHAPFLDSVTVTDEAVTVDAPDAADIEWVAGGESVASGETVRLETVADRPYVRAEVRGDGDGVTLTQPFYVE